MVWQGYLSMIWIYKAPQKVLRSFFDVPYYTSLPLSVLERKVRGVMPYFFLKARWK